MQRGRLDWRTVLNLGRLPESWRLGGIPDLPVVLTQSVIRKVTRDHGVTWDQLRMLQTAIHRPIAIFETQPGARVALTEMNVPDGDVVVAVHMGATQQNQVINDIRSIHNVRSLAA